MENVQIKVLLHADGGGFLHVLVGLRPILTAEIDNLRFNPHKDINAFFARLSNGDAIFLNEEFLCIEEER